MSKPELIVRLEQELGVVLEEVSLEEIRENFGPYFALNEQREVIGLDLGNNQIQDLNPLQGLTGLTELDLSGNQIQNLSPLQHLTGLTVLWLEKNQIQDLSPLQGLSGLTELYLKDNQIQDLSPLQGLTGLTELDLSGNQIQDLSPLQGLTGLTWLGLLGNQDLDLSPLKGLTGLTYLDLTGNQVQDLSVLQGLTGLVKLQLGGNQIQDLSPLQGLTGLTWLSLTGNQIQDLSPLQHLTHLTVLILWSNQVQDLSPLQHLTHLTRLWLEDNQIQDLSPLQGLTKLIWLKSERNQIQDLSPLKGLILLKHLYLKDNQIQDLSPLKGLSDLTVLDLSASLERKVLLRRMRSSLTGKTKDVQSESPTDKNNQIKDLSPLKDLTRLEYLYLQYNQVQDLSPLQGLTGLTYLDLTGNQVQDLSPLKGLTGLVELRLGGNQIKDLSPLQHLRLPNLCLLNLSGNQIQKAATFDLDNFPKLKGLTLRGNPIEDLPEEIFREGMERVTIHRADGTKDIIFMRKENDLGRIVLDRIEDQPSVRHFLKDLKKQQSQVYQAKVILIGSGRVGKTCLVKRWLDQSFNSNESSTHAIQLRTHPLEKLTQEKQFDSIQLHIWDFGGQDIYHATHRLFMKTKAAIFVLVWDVQTERMLEQIESSNGREVRYQNYPLNYWLDYAKNLGNNSPVLIVQTQRDRDGESVPKNLEELRERYNIIASIAVESSRDRCNGFPIFEQHLSDLVEKQLDTHCTALPESWWQVLKQVQQWQSSKKTISTAEFEGYCEQVGLDLEHVPTVLDYLHDTGWLFYRKTLFQNQILIDQKWAIDAVYTLFDREKIFPRLVQNGEFRTADLKGVWQQFTEAEQTLFLGFMKSCDICFELDHEWDKPFDQRRFIAPALLPEQKPSALIETWSRIDKKWIVRYQYQFLHYGNLQSFIVRTHTWGTRSELWKNGCQLKDEAGNLALIEGFFERDKQYVQVTVTGDGPQTLLDKVRNKLDAIQQDDHDQVEELWSWDGQSFVRKQEAERDPEKYGAFLNRNPDTVFSVWETALAALRKYEQPLSGNKNLTREFENFFVPNRLPKDLLNYSRNVLEAMVIELCPEILKGRERGTEPLQGILDKFKKDKTIPEYVISGMYYVNDLGRYGAHPKEFDQDQVAQSLLALGTVLKWFIKRIENRN